MLYLGRTSTRGPSGTETLQEKEAQRGKITHSTPIPTPNIVLLIILQIARHVLEAHASMLNLSALDAKLQYIRNWQALQDFGITYFLVKVGKSKKEASFWW